MSAVSEHATSKIALLPASCVPCAFGLFKQIDCYNPALPQNLYELTILANGCGADGKEGKSGCMPRSQQVSTKSSSKPRCWCYRWNRERGKLDK